MAEKVNFHVVNEIGEKGWDIRVTSPDGSVTFVFGPELPPLNDGSVRLFTGTNGDQGAEIRSDEYRKTRLADLTALRYWTYDVQNNGQQWPYIILQLDLNGDQQVDDLIFFEPAYQTPATGNPALPDQGPTILNAWQQWNALVGGWWSANGIAGATPGTGVKSLSDYLAVQPNARIVNSPDGLGGVRLVHGFASATDVFDGNVDAVTIGVRGKTFIYDFEPPTD
jgi:hypothetical protein